MAESKYTAPNDFRAFCEILDENQTSMAHHGVKGQKWGVRKYQNMDGSLTAAGRKHYGYGAKKKTGTEEDPKKKTSDMDKKLEELETRYQFNKPYTARDPLVRAAIKATLDFDKERTHGLHQGETEERERARDATKQALSLAYGTGIGIGALYGTGVGAATGAVGIGTGIGAAAGAAAGTYLSIPVMANYAAKAISAKHANNKMEKQIKEIQNNTNVDKKSGVKLKNKEMTADEDMAYVNPGFKNWSDNTKNNCLLCSNAYALRRKGYDVMANGASDGYMGQIFTHFYPDAQMRRVKLPSYISKRTMPELVNALGIPDGGYGAISVTWKGDQGGHSMIYAVENGKPVLRDCQSNQIYRGVKVRQTLENTTKDVRITRLDNVEPDIKAMINANAINPGGQNFKPKQTEAEKAIESYKTPPAEMSKANGKHGDTGFIKNLYYSGNTARAIELTKAERRTNKEKKEAFKNTEKTYDGKSRGFDAPLIRDNTYVFDKEVLYNTAYTNKKGRQIKVTVATDSSSKETANKGLNSGAKTAKQVADNEASITAQARQKLLSNKRLDFYDISDSDFRSIANKLKISSITTAAKKPGSGLIVLSYDSPKHGKVNVDADFVTLPNGKIIVVGANPNADD